ncbi:MAG TPA: lysophospholipid acyltransferase family protein [Anaerolineales bacterium]|nr:lysophospholipid acyltransferase family protein [Anaerolineales bacterium]
MLTQPSPPPKPIADIWRPDLVALPQLTFRRRVFRAFFRGFAKLLVLVTLRPKISGLENFPKRGPAIIAFNHLGDADAILLFATLPFSPIEGIGKIELYDHWLVGPVFRAYGIIWVHRGQPDRKAIRAALSGVAEGRMISLAPEGRQSVTGALEEGEHGAAFLAMKSGAPIVPVALTGLENQNVYRHLKTWKRAPASLSVGKPFFLQENPQGDRQQMIQKGTRQIMESLADLLPESYRGYYKSAHNE